jgi:uncharacterized membrane protein YhhN
LVTRQTACVVVRLVITKIDHGKDPFQVSWKPTTLVVLAGAAGFEPATYGFGDRRSTS